MADLTPKSFFEEKIAQKLANKPELAKAVNAIYEFNIEGDDGGTWTVDLTKEPGTVAAGSSGAAQCVVKAKSADFISIVTGKLNAQMAFMSGKIKIPKGGMDLAMKLTKVIS